MSDDLDPDVPAPALVAPPEPLVAEPAAAVAAPDPPPDEDADLTDPELLKDETRIRAILSETSRMRAVNRDLKQKAAKVDELEAYARDSKPYIEFLKANPGLISQRQAPAPLPGEPVVDPQTEALAKTLDLYTPEGKPDIGRAQTIRQMMVTTAQQIAQQAVAPMHQQSAQDQSARNFQLALQIKDADGRSPSAEALTQIWRTMDPRQTADPNVASILALTALGLDRVQKKGAPAAPLQAPLVTEGSAGAPRRASMSQLEQSVARDRGISEAKWTEHTKGFVHGRPVQLED